MAALPPLDFSLETENFLLRPMRRGDASEALSSWTDDPAASEMLNTPKRQWTLSEQITYFSKFEGQRDRFLLGIFPKGEKLPIGLLILYLQAANSLFSLSHMIGNVAWRGKTVTAETTEALYEYFFNKMGYAKAKATVRPHNRPMLWLMLAEKIWRKEAHLVGHLRDPTSGERADLIVLGMLADDWRAKR